MFQSVDEYRNSANGIVAQLIADPTFRQRVLAAPRQALAAAGFDCQIHKTSGGAPQASSADRRAAYCKCTKLKFTCKVTCDKSCKVTDIKK